MCSYSESPASGATGGVSPASGATGGVRAWVSVWVWESHVFSGILRAWIRALFKVLGSSFAITLWRGEKYTFFSFESFKNKLLASTQSFFCRLFRGSKNDLTTADASSPLNS